MAVAGTIGEAFIAIRPKTDGFEKELQGTVGTAGAKVAKTLAATIGSAFVLTKIKSFTQAGIAELKDAAAAQAQTAAAIKSTGGAAGVTAEQVGQMSERLLKVSGVDDELIQKGANLLLTFTNVRNEVGKGNDIFNQATEAALDLSRAGFGSVESASVLLGKALNDPVAGLTALQRVGVRLSDSQKELVRSLVASGDTLAAQKVILEEVNKQVGGSAEAYGKTLPGQIDIATQSMENMKGQMVAGLAPALSLTAGAATFLTEQFAKQPQTLQAVEGGILLTVGALGSIITPLKSGIDLWRSFGDGAKLASTAADAAKFSNSAEAVTGLYTSTSRATTAMKGLGIAAGAAAVAFGFWKLNEWSQDMQAIKIDVDEVSASLAGFGEGQEAVDQLFKFSEAAGETDKVVKQLADSNLVGAQRMVDYAKAHGVAGDELAALQAIVDDEAASQRQAAEDADANAAAIGDVGDAAAGAVDPMTGLATATRDATDGFGDGTPVVKDYKTQLEEARQAVEDLFDTTQSSIDAQFAYRDSLDTTEDSLAKLTELQKAGKGNTEEYQRATNDAEEALYGQSEAAVEAAVQQAELAGVTLDASTKAQIQVSELEKLRDSVGPNTPLGKRLQAHIDALNRIPRRKQTTVDVLTGQALVDLDRFARRLRDTLPPNSRIRISVGGGGGQTIAAGGIVEARRFGFGGPVGTDTVPAWLTPGEFVSTKTTVDRLGVDFFKALNAGNTPVSTIVAQSSAMSEPLVQNIYTTDPVEAASEAARRHRAYRNALTLR